jgi:hypothetical protein
MGSDERWLTFRDASAIVASGNTRSGRSQEACFRDATRRLWQAYWSSEFQWDRLRFCLETPHYRDPKRYRPTPEDARPDLLVRVIGGGRHVPEEVLDEGGGIARLAAAAVMDPYLACPQFLQNTFLEIEIAESELKAWRRRRAAGSRDNGRALFRHWLELHPDYQNRRAEEILSLARKEIPNLSERGCLEVLRRKTHRKVGRPSRREN